MQQQTERLKQSYPKVGELVGLGSPIMSISMVDDIWGTFNVREIQLKDMKVGTVLKAYVPCSDKNIELRVTLPLKG